MNSFKSKTVIYILIALLLVSLAVMIVVQPFSEFKNDEAEETIETTEVTEVTEPRSTEEKIEIVEELITEATDETEPTIVDIPEMATTETTAATETTEPIETEPIITEPPVDPNSGMTDVEMLALVIFQEVGGDHHCDDCRRRVADVVLNRVAHDDFPDTIYEVLTQKGQYGRLYWTGLVWAERASNQYEQHAVERAYRIAEEVLNGQHSELYGKGYIWQAEFVQGKDNIYCCGHYFGR